MATSYIGVSTKAYLGYDETLAWLSGVRAVLDARPGLADAGIQAFVIPSSPLLLAARDALDGTGCWIGAQDAHWSAGAATGGVSPALLAELGVTLVEIGHAERRRIFGETDEQIALKTAAVLEAGLIPLLCVGEPSRVDPAEAARVCAAQVRSAVPAGRHGDVILAYEPWWAIGAAEPASPDYVNAVVRELRTLGCRGVVYGGSAGPGTLGPLHVDGLFLGRFAHDPANFGRVLDEALSKLVVE
jgi:triosephosphate isomerase